MYSLLTFNSKLFYHPYRLIKNEAIRAGLKLRIYSKFCTRKKTSGALLNYTASANGITEFKETAI